jgi:hypothetical protein
MLYFRAVGGRQVVNFKMSLGGSDDFGVISGGFSALGENDIPVFATDGDDR